MYCGEAFDLMFEGRSHPVGWNRAEQPKKRTYVWGILSVVFEEHGTAVFEELMPAVFGESLPLFLRNFKPLLTPPPIRPEVP